MLLKLELLSPIRSFKHRGALVAVDRIAREQPGTSIFTASTGNHGQGVAYAAAPGRPAGDGARSHHDSRGQTGGDAQPSAPR